GKNMKQLLFSIMLVLLFSIKSFGQQQASKPIAVSPLHAPAATAQMSVTTNALNSHQQVSKPGSVINNATISAGQHVQSKVQKQDSKTAKPFQGAVSIPMN